MITLLSGSFTPDNELSADKTSQTQTVNTENTATEQETDSAPSQTTEVLPAPDFLSQIMTEMS